MRAEIESRDLVVGALQKSLAEAKLVANRSCFRDNCRNIFRAYPRESHRQPWRSRQHRTKILNPRPLFLWLFGLKQCKIHQLPVNSQQIGSAREASNPFTI
jgi:hypothetical protein